MPQSNLDIARAFVAAIEAGDADAVADAYADDAEIWHNTDGKIQTKAENVATIAGFVTFLNPRQYTELRITETTDGYVQQHTLVGTYGGDKEFRLPACLIVKLADGKIVRLDEYFDSATLPGR